MTISMFQTFEDLFKFFEKDAFAHGSHLNKIKTSLIKYYEDKYSVRYLESNNINGKDNLPLNLQTYTRGKLFCSSKQCDLEINFKWTKEEQLFVVKDDSILIHSCPIQKLPDKSIIKLERDLPVDIIQSIEECGKLHGNLQYAKRLIDLKKPGMIVDSRLVRRIMDRGMLSFFGSDADSMNRFIKLGLECRERGGLWEPTHDVYGRLNSYAYSTPLMLRYLKTYGDFLILDGTENTNKYDLTMCFLSGVDSLWYTTFFGILVQRAENSDDLTRQLKSLKVHELPNSQSSVLMTDGGPWLAVVSKELQRIHIRCA